MHKIRGAHFVLAFLAVILLPGFLGAAELPDYQKYTGPIKPGVVITKANLDTYLPELKKLLPPAKLKWMSMGINEGLATLPVVKTTYAAPTRGQMEATRKYAGAARIGADNQLLNWTAGFPFPEPRNAQEIAWNCYPEAGPAGGVQDDYHMYAWFGLFKETKYEKHFVWDLFKRKYRGRVEIPPLGDMPDFTDRGINSKESIVISEPNELKGFIQLRTRYWDLDRADESYAYIPALRRIRRLTGSDLTDPLLGSDACPDDFEVWRQKLTSKMKIRVLEHRYYLVPKTYVGMESKPAYGYKKNGPCFQVEWEIRPQWVLEIMINDPDYVYSKRIVYVDAVPLDQGGSYYPYAGEEYDQKGRLWKACNMFPSANKEGFRGMFFAVYMNYQTDHYTALSSYTDYDKFPRPLPLNEEESFSIKGLLKRAR